MSTKPTDEEILTVLRERRGAANPTYYIKNVLRMGANGHKGLETPFVRRRLLALEKAGKVVRKATSYATMLHWDIAPEAAA